MATSGILESIPDKENHLLQIVELTTLNQCSTPTEEEEGEGDEDKPCIQPSDLFKELAMKKSQQIGWQKYEDVLDGQINCPLAQQLYQNAGYNE